jgi:hypothetical protein
MKHEKVKSSHAASDVVQSTRVTGARTARGGKERSAGEANSGRDALTTYMSGLSEYGMLNARKEIETFLEHPVFLELHVKTKSDWRNDKTALKSYGYDF